MTGFQLKLLAMLAMTADHIGAVFFPEIPLLRWIGRLAMPVLCFFIGEGPLTWPFMAGSNGGTRMHISHWHWDFWHCGQFRAGAWRVGSWH